MAPRIKPRLKKTVFDNGLTLLTEAHPEFRSLSMGAWVKVGTRHEHKSEAGISHFLEHMLFKGTENRTALEIAREVDRVGGDFNAFTTREHTCFHLLLLDRDQALGLDILGDVLLNSNFDGEELERERKVILQEIAMVEESPEEMAHDLYFERIYGTHGLGRPILGTQTSVRRMSRKTLLEYFRYHYRPEQMVISVAGDIDHDQVKRRVGAFARGMWPGRKELLSRGQDGKGTPMERAPRLRPGAWWMARPTEQVHLIWGLEGPDYSSRDRFAAYLLNVYLGGGMSSVLFQEIREKHGLAYTVYSNLSLYADSGVFSVYAATSARQVPLCLKLIEDSVFALRKTLIPRDELEMVKDNLKSSILLASDSSEARMSSIAKNEIYFARNISVEEACHAIDQVTPEDIRRVATRLLRKDTRSVLALGPRPQRAQLQKLNALVGGKFLIK